MNWALFEKPMAEQAGTAFENISRVPMSEGWERQMFQALGIEKGHDSHKVLLPGYMKAHRKSKYPLTEEMVVAMARIYRWRKAPKDCSPVSMRYR